MKIKGLTSTIVIGILILISVAFIVRLVPYNMKEMSVLYKESLQNSDITIENTGAFIILFNGLAAVGAIAIVLAGYIPAIFCTVVSSISLVFSINNRKSDNKAIRIINLIFDILLILIIIVSIIKIILFIVGIS